MNAVKIKERSISRTKKDVTFDIVNGIIWFAVLLAVLYPLWLVLIASVSDAEAIIGGKVFLWPVDPSFSGYRAVFQHQEFMRSFLNSIFYTVAGTSLSVIVTMMAAYALSRKFAGKKAVTLYFLFTMFFTGGLIPQFLMNMQLGLYNTMTLMIIINCVSVWNLMITRTFISTSIPNELYEAAAIDGANHFTYFFRVILPLSGTIIAVLCVFYGVARWNDYFTGLVYIRDDWKMPMQTILRRLVASLERSGSADAMLDFFGDAASRAERLRLAEVTKYSAIVVSSIPVVGLYIGMQRFFVKGVTLGSLKG
ncbi:MAG: carbohydrate ABC transporter permease [Defluviitaleaceae bacterium]|nr:carbohydrate ABC transporter permease [Defluviitaleaceae bacterium]MCL2836815.1 carbohydrate ABC transporter permease [Defluviitaleaceae bacterium]